MLDHPAETHPRNHDVTPPGLAGLTGSWHAGLPNAVTSRKAQV